MDADAADATERLITKLVENAIDDIYFCYDILSVDQWDQRTTDRMAAALVGNRSARELSIRFSDDYDIYACDITQTLLELLSTSTQIVKIYISFTKYESSSVGCDPIWEAIRANKHSPIQELSLICKKLNHLDSETSLFTQCMASSRIHTLVIDCASNLSSADAMTFANAFLVMEALQDLTFDDSFDQAGIDFEVSVMISSLNNHRELRNLVWTSCLSPMLTKDLLILGTSCGHLQKLYIQNEGSSFDVTPYLQRYTPRFVARLEFLGLNGYMFGKHNPHLPSNTSLKTLFLASCSFTRDSSGNLLQFTGLQELEMFVCTGTPAIIPEACGSLKNLKKLKLTFSNTVAIRAEGVSMLRQIMAGNPQDIILSFDNFNYEMVPNIVEGLGNRSTPLLEFKLDFRTMARSPQQHDDELEHVQRLLLEAVLSVKTLHTFEFTCYQGHFVTNEAPAKSIIKKLKDHKTLQVFDVSLDPNLQGYRNTIDFLLNFNKFGRPLLVQIQSPEDAEILEYNKHTVLPYLLACLGRDERSCQALFTCLRDFIDVIIPKKDK